MIDDIVEMILKEARGRDRINPLGQWPQIKEDIDCAMFNILDVGIDVERRKKEDENKR